MVVKKNSAEQDLLDQVEAVLDASRLLVAVSSRSLNTIDDLVSLTQFRVLVILSSRGAMDLQALAEQLGVHPSNATRACDKLVGFGLLERRENAADRRRLLLTPSTAGRELLQSVSDHRRSEIRDILTKMPTVQRASLRQVMSDFAAAGGELPNDQWADPLPR